MKNRQAICFELPATEKGALPDWLQCIPAPDVDGKVRGRDGRSWLFDQPELVLKGSPAKIIIDINHSTDLAAPKGLPAPSVGWIDGRALEVRNGGLGGQPNWNARGKAAIEGEDYGWLSPVFDYDVNGRITRLVRVSLCNAPNFDLALNTALLDPDFDDPQPENLPMKSLLKLLGLSETATEAEGVLALNALKSQHATALNTAQSTPDITKFVPRSEFDAVQQRALNAENKIADADKTKLAESIEAELDAAQTAGKITPAGREFYRATCSTQAGLAQFREFVKAAPAIVEPGAIVPPGKPPEKGTALNAAQKAVAESLGMSEAQFLKGVSA